MIALSKTIVENHELVMEVKVLSRCILHLNSSLAIWDMELLTYHPLVANLLQLLISGDTSNQKKYDYQNDYLYSTFNCKEKQHMQGLSNVTFSKLSRYFFISFDLLGGTLPQSGQVSV